MKLRLDTLVGSFFVAFGLAFIAFAITGCATSPRGRARQAAVVQKASVDGTGQAYLSYCKIVRKPACVAADKAASEAGTPQSKEDRIACLRPCDSATATKVQTAVDVVRTAQTALFEAIRDNATPEELAASRAQLQRAASQLILLLQEVGAMDLLDEAVEGISGSDREKTR